MANVSLPDLPKKWIFGVAGFIVLVFVAVRHPAWRERIIADVRNAFGRARDAHYEGVVSSSSLVRAWGWIRERVLSPFSNAAADFIDFLTQPFVRGNGETIRFKLSERPYWAELFAISAAIAMMFTFLALYQSIFGWRRQVNPNVTEWVKKAGQ